MPSVTCTQNDWVVSLKSSVKKKRNEKRAKKDTHRTNQIGLNETNHFQSDRQADRDDSVIQNETGEKVFKAA